MNRGAEPGLTRGDRLPVLDGLRAISILLVLAAHMLPLGPNILQLNHAAGGMGMSLFFALSGFLITSTLTHNQNVLEFLTKRLARILPLAYAYALIVFAFFLPDPATLLATAVFGLNYLPQYMGEYNAHFWSLCVEMHFYLAIALVVAFFGRRGLWIVWPGAVAVLCARVGLGVYYGIETHVRVDEILAGACVATLFATKPAAFVNVPRFLLLVAVLVWFASASPYGAWLQYFRPVVTAVVLATVLAQERGWITSVLSSRSMRYVAEISYALYVFHPITMIGWMNQGSLIERYMLKRPISIALTFLAAHLSSYYWEKMWRQVARRWLQRVSVRRLRVHP